MAWLGVSLAMALIGKDGNNSIAANNIRAEMHEKVPYVKRSQVKAGTNEWTRCVIVPPIVNLVRALNV
jgi:hypothetical protein